MQHFREMRLIGLWRKVVRSFKARGIRGTLRSALRRGGEVKTHPFDVLYGTDTGGVIGGTSLGAGHRHDLHITAYAGMPPSKFEGAMARWQAEDRVEPAGSFCFVDLGCGKGRVVLLASRLRFSRVVGVELDASLARIAARNLELWKRVGGAVSRIEIICGDATEYRLDDGPCLIYLANPFGAPVLRRLLEEIEKRAGVTDTAVELIYQNPAHREVFAEFPRWRLMWDEAFPLSEEDREAEPVYGSGDRCLAWRRG